MAPLCFWSTPLIYYIFVQRGQRTCSGRESGAIAPFGPLQIDVAAKYLQGKTWMLPEMQCDCRCSAVWAKVIEKLCAGPYYRINPSLKRSDMARVSYWITQFYLPRTHARTIPAFTPQPQGITALRLELNCAYPRRDGQAELTWVAGYILR